MSTEVIETKMSTNVIETVTCQFHTVPEKYYTLEESNPKKQDNKEYTIQDNKEHDVETKKDVNSEHLFIKIPKEELSSAEVSPIKKNGNDNTFEELEPQLPHIYRDGVETKEKFGILNIKIKEIAMTKRKQFVKFTCDMSGSMDDICLDGRSKMQHSVHTIKNILHMLANISTEQQSTIWVQVTGFDDEIEPIIPATRVTNDNIENLVKSLRKLYARRSTNIERALITAKEEIVTFQKEHAEDGYEITHIFTTDGNATAGKIDKNKLKELVEDTYSNVFIGFGTDHSADMLLSLSSKKKGDYYVIDKIENGGLVFGEIIHGMLYKAMTNIKIKIKNATIYNYEIDSWGNELNIDYLVSEANKTYHLLAEDPSNVEVELFGSIMNEAGDSSEVLLWETIQVTPETDPNTTDLSKYIFKQSTRQLLYQAKLKTTSTSKEVRECRKMLNIHLGKLKKFMTKYDLEEDEYYKTIADDIVVAMKTLGTYYGTMFISARHRSNGRETAYHVNEIPMDNGTIFSTPMTPITRTYGILRRASALTDGNRWYDLDEDDDNDEQFDGEEDYTQTHTLSRVPLLRSQTSKRCKTLMREVSAGIESTQEYLDELDEIEKREKTPQLQERKESVDKEEEK